MSPKTQEFREKVANIFVKSLEENRLQWKKGWNGLSILPQNAVTQSNYRGVNRFYLRCLCDVNQWDDPRFATFNQIKENGWHLKKGSKGVQVEFWMPYDPEQKKIIQWSEVTEENSKKIQVRAKYYTVFNAKDIEGIPPLPKPEIREIKADEILSKICKNMEIEILHDGGERAFYRPSEDKIHLPKKEYFKSDYDYNATALHELSHASGAEHRLNRDIKNAFGTEKYAYEELVAEISSSFMGEHLSSCVSDYHMDNHKAYVQSWIRSIKEKPEVLVKAIGEASKAADYLEKCAELTKETAYEKQMEDALEVSPDRIDNTPVETKTVAIESTYDYDDFFFHANMKNTAGIGREDYFRIVFINEHGDVQPLNKDVYTSKTAAISQAEGMRGLRVIDYEDLIENAMAIRTDGKVMELREAYNSDLAQLVDKMKLAGWEYRLSYNEETHWYQMDPQTDQVIEKKFDDFRSLQNYLEDKVIINPAVEKDLFELERVAKEWLNYLDESPDALGNYDGHREHSQACLDFVDEVRKGVENPDNCLSMADVPQYEDYRVSYQQSAEDMITYAEREQTLFCRDERDLIVNFARKTGDLTRIQEILEQIAMKGYGTQNGFVDPEVRKLVENEGNILETQWRVNIGKDIRKSGFQSSQKLVDNIIQLDRVSGTKNTLQDIAKMSKEPWGSEEIKALVSEIAKECKMQELTLCPQ